MNGSLLAFLAPQLKSPQEDVATLSLCHIIGQSVALGKAFTKILCGCLKLPVDESVSYYKTQVTGKEKERPDIVGFSNAGKEMLICEAKFYAALTENQPNGYLKRLMDSSGKGLVFLCPQNRASGLWNQLLSLVPEAEPVDDLCVSVQSVRMGIMTWEMLLEELKTVSELNGTEMMSDLLQLDVYCRQVIKNAFVPFSVEDFGADVAIGMDRYYIVIDKLRDALLSRKDYGITQGSGRSKLQSVAKWEGYSAYMKSKRYTLSVYFDRNAWKKATSMYSPFWLSIRNPDWNEDEKTAAFIATLPEWKTEMNSAGVKMIALDPPAGMILEETVQNLCEQVLKYIDDYLEFIDKFIA